MTVSSRPTASMVAVIVLGLALAGCGGADTEERPADPTPERLALVRVPQDASLSEAGDRVADGGVILIAAGTYHETLETAAADVTIRGADRNQVVIDGELDRSNGVVATGPRVAVENLTVRNHLQNGVLVTGMTDKSGAGVARGPNGYVQENIPDPVPGYLVQQVTAQNNGLYGIYAFNRTGGEIRENLASGGSDSGIYVGQCASCQSVVADNVVTSNAVGLEFANASDVTVVGNRIVGNRVGISVLSNYLEAHGPTRGMQVVGNVIADNNNPKTPEQAAGGFGIGIGLGGAQGTVLRNNRITGNGNVGIWVTSSEDFAPEGTTVAATTWGGQGVDIAYTPSPDVLGPDNCFRDSGARVTVPKDLASTACTGELAPGQWQPPQGPAGLPFAQVPLTPERPGLDVVDQSPRTVPDQVALPDLTSVALPPPTLLEKAS